MTILSSTSEVKIRVSTLRIGMFVCGLDRPWLETPFSVQGFLVRDPDDLAKVREHCTHVFVDVVRGEAPNPRFIVHDSGIETDPKALAEIEALHKTDYEYSVDLRTEMDAANETYEVLNSQVSEALTDLREGRHLDLERLSDGVNAMIDSILRCPDAFACLTDLKRKDVYAYRHSLGTSVWAATFGRHLGMDRTSITQLAMGGLLLDVGKARIPVEMLNDPDTLSEEGLIVMRSHVQHSLDIIRETSGMDDLVIEMVATHHERFDGSGYPVGLRGREIPLFGRIGGLVDAYDALTSDRSYASAMSPHAAVNLLYEWRGVEFQSELVEQFIQNVGIFPIGTLVELNDGRVGVVISLNGIRRLQPRLMILLDQDKRPLDEFFELDLLELAEKDDSSVTIKRGLVPGAYNLDPENFFL